MKIEFDSPRSCSVGAAGLLVLGAISGVGYAMLLALSGRFAGEVPAVGRPTLWMLSLFAIQFICYGLALRLAVRLPPSRWLLGGIFAGACLFRGVLLPSIPMHEIDIYRYLWDGAVLANGVSPYRYSPRQVIEAADAPSMASEPALRQLVELQANCRSLASSLREIHYGVYPSPYPLVSQAVFALSAQLTPASATRFSRVVVMKSFLVVIDLATLVVVMLLLRDIGQHPGWSLAYGWCPLLMKEVANGGHLDPIAILLTTIACWGLAKTGRLAGAANAQSWLTGVVWTGAALALAIGAKLYPVVLIPLFSAVWLRRHGWAAAVLGLTTIALLTSLTLYPLLRQTPPQIAPLQPAGQAASQSSIPGQLNVPGLAAQQTTSDPSAGVEAFLSHWEMNDLVFMVVLENLRQQSDVIPHQKPWFVWSSDRWSTSIVTRWVALLTRWQTTATTAEKPAQPLTPRQLKRGSFSLARTLTGGVFVIIASVLAWRAAGESDPRCWCRAGLLTLAWFWLTCPTQNPWYWCWVLPLLPFARYRTWYFVAAATMLYYLRFWLIAHYPQPPVFGTRYDGAYFFYFVIPWIEFVPCLIALSVEWLYCRKRKHLP